jgi:hypothetical protein
MRAEKNRNVDTARDLLVAGVAAILKGAAAMPILLSRRQQLIAGLSVATVLVVLYAGAEVPRAQTAPLPTYGPPAASMQPYQSHVFRTFQLNVSAFVPLAQLQSILPSGFNAIATGPDIAQVGIGLIFHQRTERLGAVDGPLSALVVTAVARNLARARNETLLLANEQNDPVSVTNTNALFGEGTTRLADVTARIDEKNGLLYFKFDAKDNDIGLKLKIQAIASAAGMTRVNQDPAAVPFRAVNGTTAANAFFGTNRYDNVTAMITDDNFKLDVPNDTLGLPGGNLRIVSVGSTIAIHRWRENFFKLEDE